MVVSLDPLDPKKNKKTWPGRHKFASGEAVHVADALPVVRPGHDQALRDGRWVG